jgi:hypothetical protein
MSQFRPGLALLDLFLFISKTSKEQQSVLLARFSSFVFWSCRRIPAHSRGTYSSRNCCRCTPYGIAPQEHIALGSRSGQFRRPNNEVRLLLRPLELLLNLALNPFQIAFRCVYRAVYVRQFIRFSISGNSKSGHYRSEWQAALNRHSFQRVCKFRTAVTAHPVGLTLQCEHTAEASVVTPKEEIKDS